MSYQEVLAYLLEQLPMYQRIGSPAYKNDLNTSLELDKLLNHPHKNYPCIHIAGTNGKGSTAHIMASALQSNGLKTGLLTSPHYKNYRERIKINGAFISEEYVLKFITEHKEKWNDLQPSFFEITCLMGMEYFKNQKVDVAILETGMGGRLDTTNIINPVLSIITSISLDHTQFLGSTIEAISTEKGGIIKNNVPVVIGRCPEASEKIFEKIATDKSAPIFFTRDYLTPVPQSDLRGKYQGENLKTASLAIEVLGKMNWNLKPDKIAGGFKNVIANTHLIGRMQVLSSNPIVLADSAHNEEGLTVLFDSLKTEFKFDKLHVVFGTVQDKDISRILSILPKDASYYFCSAEIPRALDSQKLKDQADRFLEETLSFNSVVKALQNAKSKASKKDLILICGSIFVVAEAL